MGSTVFQGKEMNMDYYQHTTKLLNDLKAGELLYRYCFYDNFVSKNKLKKLITKIGDDFEDEYNDENLMILAEKIHGQVNIIGSGIRYHHIKAILKNEGRKKLTKTKQRLIKGMLMHHSLKIENDKCVKCGSGLIMIKVKKNFMKMMGKKVPKGDMVVKILKCGCGEKLKLYSPRHNNSYTKKL